MNDFIDNLIISECITNEKDKIERFELTVIDNRIKALVKKGLAELKIVDVTSTRDDAIQEVLVCVIKYTRAFLSKNLNITLQELTEAVKDIYNNDIARAYFSYLNKCTQGHFKDLKKSITKRKQEEFNASKITLFCDMHSDEFTAEEAIDFVLNKQQNYNTQELTFFPLWLKKNAKDILTAKQYAVFTEEVYISSQKKRTHEAIAKKLFKAYKAEFGSLYSKELDKKHRAKKILDIIEDRTNILTEDDLVADIIYRTGTKKKTLMYFTEYINTKGKAYSRQAHRLLNSILLKEYKKLIKA